MKGDQIAAFAIQQHLIFRAVSAGFAVLDHQNDEDHLKSGFHFVGLFVELVFGCCSHRSQMVIKEVSRLGLVAAALECRHTFRSHSKAAKMVVESENWLHLAERVWQKWFNSER